MAASAIFLCKTEVYADALDVSDMQISIGLRWKSRNNLIAWDPTVLQIILYDLLQEIKRLLFFHVFHATLLTCLSKGNLDLDGLLYHFIVFCVKFFDEILLSEQLQEDLLI